MSHVGVSASRDGLALAPAPADDGGDLDDVLARRLRAAGPDAPVVVLIHGYRFDPFRRDGARDPHRSLFAFRPEIVGRKVRSWPQGLGFDPRRPERGLGVGFAWPAAEAHLPALLAEGRTGFARVYARAGAMGIRLAELVARIRRLAPGRPVDVLAHSLGARVALAALPHLADPPERIVLLGAAEFDARAREALAASPAARPPAIYNVTARANDLYDLAFETFAPRRSWRDRALGLGLADRPAHWLDLQIDRTDVTAWANAQGISLAPAAARPCHWSFYTRAGAFDLYQAVLRRRPGWDIADLAPLPCFTAQEPRWSRLAPSLGRRVLPALPPAGVEVAFAPDLA